MLFLDAFVVSLELSRIEYIQRSNSLKSLFTEETL